MSSKIMAFFPKLKFGIERSEQELNPMAYHE